MLMHILSSEQFDKQTLETLFDKAAQMKNEVESNKSNIRLAQQHIGKQVLTLFYEPSTRTRISFEQAALKLGASVVSTESAGVFSSAAKGESLKDTIRVINGYGFGAIVLRHSQKGAASEAASISETPVINAGDGNGEHPTQALLDAFTIYQKFGRLSNLNIAMGGDLKNGRTVHSLAKLISKYDNNTISFISVPELQIGDDIRDFLTNKGLDFKETDDMEGALKEADVIYWTRLQKERLEEQDSFKNPNFVINKAVLEFLRKDSIILHPLPRLEEISEDVDSDPRAMYFEQASNGLFVRMALLDDVLSNS